jgi:pyruvate formate lyase activating enzyme
MQSTCNVCPWKCILEEGELGKCKARTNNKGIVQPANPYFISTAIIGPIEQKGIYHFHPGSNVVSVGSVGCNLSCDFCQNFSISQVAKTHGKTMCPEDLVSLAISKKADGIAFTYNEPLVNYEYVMRVFDLARKFDLITVLKTAGMVDQHIFAEICKLADCVNIDLKGDHQIYKDVCHVDPSWMDIVLLNIGTAFYLTHTEISIPVITNYEDNARKAADLLCMDVGIFPLHLLRFIPDFRMKDIPATSLETLEILRDYLLEEYSYVYIDFAEMTNETKCPSCKELILKREGAKLSYNSLKADLCPSCGEKQDIKVKVKSCFTTTSVPDVSKF